MELNHWDEDKDGPLTETAMRDKLIRMGYAVTQYVYPPGTVFLPHDHVVDKSMPFFPAAFACKWKDKA